MYRKPYLTAALVWLALLAASLQAPVWGQAGTPTPGPSNTATPAPKPSVKATATATPSTTPEAPSLQAAVSAMGKIQALVEFYYMNTGTYPVTLDELNTQYNNQKPTNGARVTLPLDPATNKPFDYQPGDDGNSYAIRAPNPDAYGVKSLELTNIDWGWMRSIADEHKRAQLTELCSIYIKGLSNALDAYARDNKNTLPDSLDALVPKYVKKLPNCPETGKPFVYKKSDRGYVVAAPDPKAYGLEVLEYSSTEGFKRR